MTTTVLTHRLSTIEQEIQRLQTLLQGKQATADKIQHLFTEAEAVLETLQEAIKLLPSTFVNPLKDEIARLFGVTNPLSSVPIKKRSYGDSLWEASQHILSLLKQEKSITAKELQTLMTKTFSGSDAAGLWQWKDAYEALEIALVLYLRTRPALSLEEILNLEQRLPTHTRRTEESLAFQQFSSPLPLGLIMAEAAGLNQRDIVLEPSAGNGLLAIWAEKAGAKLILNELAEPRRQALTRLFPHLPIFGYNAEQIHNYLPKDYQPTVALLNPPFSASPNMEKRNSDATFHHLYSALERLPKGGRLVALTANWFAPHNPKWKEAFARLEQLGKVVFSVGIDGKLYYKQGTATYTRLTVIDKGAEGAPSFITTPCCDDVRELLQLVRENVPPRFQNLQSASVVQRTTTTPIKATKKTLSSKKAQSIPVVLSEATPEVSWGEAGKLTYTKGIIQTEALSDALYQAYTPQSIAIKGAGDHPTPLVQSAAMASVVPPIPSYQPTLPENLPREGILSAPQLESVIYAGEAHSQLLSGHFLVDDTLEKVRAASPDTDGAVQFRRGWLLGDGTGTGKGRQAAGIILDNWLQGRTRAIWVSKSDKLIEDARRDWTALGGDKSQIISLQKFRQGQTIELQEGILFATYALLRVKGRQGKISRVEQLINWLGSDFDGVIIFDECHAMGSALSSVGSRGTTKPSQQGLAGLKLQYALPNARVVYVSATGATKVSNLAYATRLGLWQSADFPFASQMDFIGSVEQGGLAAMEVVCRDLKALGLYAARSLSYEGVEYDILEHQLTPEQIKIYDAYANAYKVIHQNLNDALEATNIVSMRGGTRNSQAKSAARSAFEGAKQRFFNHVGVTKFSPQIFPRYQHGYSHLTEFRGNNFLDSEILLLKKLMG